MCAAKAGRYLRKNWWWRLQYLPQQKKPRRQKLNEDSDVWNFRPFSCNQGTHSITQRSTVLGIIIQISINLKELKSWVTTVNENSQKKSCVFRDWLGLWYCWNPGMLQVQRLWHHSEFSQIFTIYTNLFQ